MGNVSAEERPLIGKMVNETREEIENELTDKKAKLEDEAILKSLENTKKIDFSIHPFIPVHFVL